MAVFTGTAANDNWAGSAGDDQAEGGGGDDVLTGGGGADTLSGGEGYDLLVSQTTASLGPVHFGWASQDTASDIDILSGGANIDRLVAGYGDQIDGGAGDDALSISFRGASAGVTADFRLLGTQTSITAGSTAISNVENVYWIEGSEFADFLADRIIDLYQQGWIYGRGGDDHIMAGSNVRRAEGGDGNDRIEMRSNSYGNEAYGDAGDDLLIGWSYDYLYGGEGNDEIRGGGTSTWAWGGPGDDLVNAYGGGEDELRGEAGSDVIYAGGDMDVVHGGDGDDYIEGDGVQGQGIASPYESADRLYGGAGSDEIHGQHGADVVDGGLDADRLYGQAGDDQLWATVGDVVDGGAGADRVHLDFAQALTGLHFDFRTLAGGGAFNVHGISVSEVESIGTILGTALADVLTQSAIPAGEALRGGGGDDRLHYSGLGTGVILAGGDGNDVVDATNATGTPSLYGDGGHDELLGSPGADLLDGGSGDDVLLGGAGDDHLYGDLQQSGSTGDDVLIAGAGADWVFGGEGSDILYFGAHWGSGDRASGSTTSSLVLQGVYAETVQLSNSSVTIGRLVLLHHADTTYGGHHAGPSGYRLVLSGNLADRYYAHPFTVDGSALAAQAPLQVEFTPNTFDPLTLLGGAGNDILRAGSVNDRLRGGAGADELDGGAGADTADYGNAATAVFASLVNPLANLGDAAGDSYLSIENLLLGGGDDTGEGDAGANEISGGSGNDLLRGGAGMDTLLGGSGNDELWGDAGPDRMEGGEGFDVARYDDAPGGLVVALSNVPGSFWPVQNTGIAAGDAFLGVEGLILSAFADLAYGTNVADALMGVGGRDALYGQAGNDQLFGGADHDLLWGGLGADFHDGGDGFDYVRYDDATFPGMVAALFAPQLNTGAAAGDTYANVEGLILGYFNDTGYGSNAADYVYGINGNDALYGQGGDDSIYGGDGNDLVWGGLGADALDGGNGFDYARYDDATFPSLVASLLDPSINTGAAAGDTYTGLEGLILGFFDDTGHGSNASDYLYGINGNDTLHGQGGGDFVHGGAGNDVLIGGLGNDQLSGDVGVDVFRFDTPLHGTDNVDRILDFVSGTDQIRLENAVFTSLAANGTLNASMFRSGAGVTTAADADDYVLHDTTTGFLYYDADGTGGAAAVVFAVLAAGAALNAQDILIS